MIPRVLFVCYWFCELGELLFTGKVARGEFLYTAVFSIGQDLRWELKVYRVKKKHYLLRSFFLHIQRTSFLLIKLIIN